MGNFFHGWRRKTGCTTLAVAVVLLVLCYRSLRMFDSIQFNVSRTWILEMQSHGSAAYFGWRSLSDSSDGILMRQDRFVDWWTSQTEFDGWKFLPRSRSGRWEEISATSPPVILGNGNSVTVSLPYLTAIFVLTVTSSVLILWKPRSPSAD